MTQHAVGFHVGGDLENVAAFIVMLRDFFNFIMQEDPQTADKYSGLLPLKVHVEEALPMDGFGCFRPSWNSFSVSPLLRSLL